MPFETVVRKTIEYLSIPSVVGHESYFTQYLKNDFDKLGLTTKQHNGILEVSGHHPYAQIISAHIDRHGLISMGRGSYKYAAEYVREDKYKEENAPSKSMIQAIGERFIGERVFAYNPQTGEKIGQGTIQADENSFEKQDVLFHIPDMPEMQEGTPVAYARTAVSDNQRLKGQIDNVISIGIIYTLFQNGFTGTALFSTEEEIGKSWIHLTNWLEQHNINDKQLLILDTSPYREQTPIDQHMVILRNRDKSDVFNTDFVQKIKKRCAYLGLPFQMKDEYFLSLGLGISDLGSTELGRIVANTKGRWNGASIQIPTLEYHTSYETTSRGCIENYYALLQNILLKPV